MQQKYFVNTFAVNGTITPIPDATDPNGFVSYSEGFNFNYQRNITNDSAAKDISRANFNALISDITTNLQNYQQYGSPEQISSAQNGGTAFPYRQGAMVRYSANGLAPFHTYISVVDNNTSTPGADANWFQIDQILATATALTAETAGRAGGDNTLQANLNAEATARNNEDVALSGSITTVNNSLTGEIANRENADAQNLNYVETSYLAFSNIALSSSVFQMAINGTYHFFIQFVPLQIQADGVVRTYSFPQEFPNACLLITGNYGSNVPPAEGSVGFQPLNAAQFTACNSAISSSGGNNGAYALAMGF